MYQEFSLHIDALRQDGRSNQIFGRGRTSLPIEQQIYSRLMRQKRFGQLTNLPRPNRPDRAISVQSFISALTHNIHIPRDAILKIRREDDRSGRRERDTVSEIQRGN